MNTKKSLELETPTTLEEIKQQDRPRYDVPIMIEITEEDLDQAGDFCDCRRCLIGTVLTRLGYTDVSVHPRGVSFNNGKNNFHCTGIRALDLQNYNLGERPKYKSSVVGKQIILYPENT